MFRAIEAGLSRPAATSLSSEKACSLRAATGAQCHINRLLIPSSDGDLSQHQPPSSPASACIDEVGCLLGKDVGQRDRAARARGVSGPRLSLHLVGFVQWQVECLQESADFLPGH